MERKIAPFEISTDKRNKERLLIEKFGQEYRTYMNQTEPLWPKIR